MYYYFEGDPWFPSLVIVLVPLPLSPFKGTYHNWGLIRNNFLLNPIVETIMNCLIVHPAFLKMFFELQKCIDIPSLDLLEACPKDLVVIAAHIYMYKPLYYLCAFQHVALP